MENGDGVTTHYLNESGVITDQLRSYELQTCSREHSLQMHRDLSALRAAVKNPDAESEIVLMEREVKQAYDLYHEKLDEVRDWGCFVFEGEERENEYKSEYMQRRYKKGKATKRANAAAESVESGESE